MKSRWIIILLLAVALIGALLWFAPNIISYLQNPTNSSDASYTSLTLRDGMNDSATLNFGDTEYTLRYAMGYLYDLTFIEQETAPYTHVPHAGDVYKEVGIEVDVSKVGSDYISNYIVILVRPTVQNYMASLHYTEVNITLYQTQAVNISSGLTNETHLYRFTYTLSSGNYGNLEIQNSSQNDFYDGVGVGRVISYHDNSDIEVRVFKVEPQYMVIYVKPLY